MNLDRAESPAALLGNGACQLFAGWVIVLRFDVLDYVDRRAGLQICDSNVVYILVLEDAVGSKNDEGGFFCKRPSYSDDGVRLTTRYYRSIDVTQRFSDVALRSRYELVLEAHDPIVREDRYVEALRGRKRSNRCLQVLPESTDPIKHRP